MREFSIAVIAFVTSVGLSPLAASADELNLPDRKPGLWELSTQPAGLPKAITTKMCLDQATDKAMMKLGMSISQCDQLTMSHDGNDLVIDSVCTVGGAKMKTHAVISGDFQSAYAMKSVSDRISGASNLPAHSEVTQQATWISDCPSDMKPGDMTLPNGMKMNVLKVLGGG